MGQRGGRRKKRRGGFIRGGDSREHNQRTTQGISFSDQAFTADSEVEKQLFLLFIHF